MRAENVFSLLQFLDQISGRFGSIFVKKQILAMTSMNDFSVTTTAQEQALSKEFATELTGVRANVGELYTRILHTLGRKWEDSVTSLARALGQPASTVEYHLKKLARNRSFWALDISSTCLP